MSRFVSRRSPMKIFFYNRVKIFLNSNDIGFSKISMIIITLIMNNISFGIRIIIGDTRSWDMDIKA